jgi:predicted DNA binding CopG/RHH family protein
MQYEGPIAPRLKIARRTLSCLSRREREAELYPVWEDYRQQSMRRNLLKSPEYADQIVELARAEALVWQALADRNGEAMILALAISMADAFIMKGEHWTLRIWSEELYRVAYKAERGSGGKSHRAA